jgi:pyruvate/2-oxoglutarate dehydrogenase complex dihydrolipoamide dehydrogenase (E3) component
VVNGAGRFRTSIVSMSRPVASITRGHGSRRERPRSRPRRDKPFGWKSIVGSYKPICSDIPSCVFNVRALASVGKTEAKAKAEGRAEKTYTNEMLDWLAAKTFGEAAAWAKVLVDEGADQVLGAHIVGHSGDEPIHVFALAMAHKVSARALRETVFAFPTISGDIKNML